MSIITVGIDLAKNVFAVHGVDEYDKAVLIKPKVAREQLLSLIVQLPPCLIGMEACSGAHHWARLFRQHGHTVKLMAPNSSPRTVWAVNAAKPTPRMLLRFAKRSLGLTCALYRSRKRISRSSSACTARGKASSKNAPPSTTGCAA